MGVGHRVQGGATVNFDVRSYCERLAKADPERFEFIEFSHADHFGRGWLLVDRYTHYSARGNETPEATWAFVGPLADEFGVEINGKLTLEATFAAVVEKLEDAKP